MSRKKKISSREKGKRGELELVHLLKANGIEARRGQQHAGGPDSPDVVHTMDGIHVECKRTEALNLYAAFEQACNDCGLDIPTVWHRKNEQKWVVILSAEDFIGILKEADRA